MFMQKINIQKVNIRASIPMHAHIKSLWERKRVHIHIITYNIWIIVIIGSRINQSINQ